MLAEGGFLPSGITVGDLEEVSHHPGDLVPDLLSEVYTSKASREGSDDVRVLHASQRIFDSGEVLDVLSECFILPLDEELQVPGVPRPVIGALEVVVEQLLKVLPALNASFWEAGEPRVSQIDQV